MPKNYTAEATLIFINQQGSISFGISNNFVFPGKNAGIDGNEIKQILESRTLISDVIKKNDLTTYFKASLSESIDILRKKIKIVYFQFNKILIIKITLDNAELTAKVVNSFIETLEEINQKLKLSTEKNLVTVLDPAIVPEKPSGPSTKKNMISAFFIALFLSYLLCFFWGMVKAKE